MTAMTLGTLKCKRPGSMLRVELFLPDAEVLHRANNVARGSLASDDRVEVALHSTPIYLPKGSESIHHSM